MTIGERIKECRCNLKITLETVAQRVGVSRQTIQRYESGVISNIPLDTIKAIAEILHTTPSYLAGWESAEGISLTHQEEELIIKYRSNPQMQEAVNKLLGI